MEMASRMDGLPGIAAIELNISCPNVSHGVDLGVDPEMCRRVVAGCRGSVQFSNHRQIDTECDEHCHDCQSGD